MGLGRIIYLLQEEQERDLNWLGRLQTYFPAATFYVISSKDKEKRVPIERP